MPEIHYTDAILTALFGAQIWFARWVVLRFMRIDERMAKHERKMKKYYRKANIKGAEIVAEALRSIRQQDLVRETK